MGVKNFPAPQDKENPRGKPRCSWRSKSKPCEVCGKPITDLPRSVFITRKMCSVNCRRNRRINPKKAHKYTKSRRAAGLLLAQVVSHLTDLIWWDCCVVALYVMEDNPYGKVLVKEA